MTGTNEGLKTTVPSLDVFQQRYQADADFSLTVKMIPAIAFCPVADVVDAFETHGKMLLSTRVCIV
jgi:hypothetical protein